MITIIGLGNPGEQYKNTRHNVGFIAIDAFAEKNNFPDFKLSHSARSGIARQKNSGSLISEGIIDGKNILLAKPQTFMNESGKSVKKIVSNNNVENLIVIHDDIDLPIGKIKIITERGSAGHKGVESIIENIGNEGLIRFRIGIASPAEAIAKEGREKALKVVLKNFSKEEQDIINETINKTVEALNMFITDGLEKTMNKFNT